MKDYSKMRLSELNSDQTNILFGLFAAILVGQFVGYEISKTHKGISSLSCMLAGVLTTSSVYALFMANKSKAIRTEISRREAQIESKI